MTPGPDELTGQVLRWIAEDPDPASQTELRSLLGAWPESQPELADRFGSRLRFGTAGLRGRLRAGPNGMNLAVVRVTTAGLVSWLAARRARGAVVIGHDARHGSRAFAEEAARVVAGAGRQALLLPSALPTPVLAAVVRSEDAAAGVMVTASHNPAQDNGYKVFLGRELGGTAGAGAQLVAPADTEIEAAIADVGPPSKIPLGPLPDPLPETVVDAYITRAAEIVRSRPAVANVRVAYTPLHGVGARVFARAMVAAGLPEPRVVPEQAAPNPDFPTVAFPNPEEAGATDLLLELARQHRADVAIAHDPDADRCSVSVATDASMATWRALTGDELGVLLADHLIRLGRRGRYTTTIVSSTLLSRLCAARGVPYGETLTGFKWIVRSGEDLAFGYEEALGYCVLPDLVRDKDGITAALLVCDLVASLAERGSSVTERLDELAQEFGVHATGQLAIRVSRLPELQELMRVVRASPFDVLAGAPVTAHTDHLPQADVLTFHTPRSRVVIRPSGTEPKLKVYLETIEHVGDDGLPAARRRADTGLAALRAQLSAALADIARA